MIRGDLGVGERDVLCILKLIKLWSSSAWQNSSWIAASGFKNVIQMENYDFDSSNISNNICLKSAHWQLILVEWIDNTW